MECSAPHLFRNMVKNRNIDDIIIRNENMNFYGYVINENIGNCTEEKENAIGL